MLTGSHWDIFCTVIDNYGDIGITWRLARQLVCEHGKAVRLWVDDLESFRHIRPEVRPDMDVQTVSGVLIQRWLTPFPDTQPGAVVIEALACHLPESYEQAMARQPVKPVWINLEYLSSEDWVAGCHGLPSPHPRLPLTKYFFMPGYTPGTGGVLIEHDLLQERNAFQSSSALQHAFWQSLGLSPPQLGELRISLFSYESQAIQDLLATWANGGEPVCCLVPAGKSLADVAAFFQRPEIGIGESLSRGNLTVHFLPMLDQDSYDHLLWACDFNFVRGEDSFVRAQLAGKPLVWQAYRQEEGAHWLKINAFLDLYCTGLDPECAEALLKMWQVWNEDGLAGAAWPAFRSYEARLTTQADDWLKQLGKTGDLAANLVKFCNEKSK